MPVPQAFCTEIQSDWSEVKVLALPVLNPPAPTILMCNWEYKPLVQRNPQIQIQL